jgi:hypothetical protein
MPIVYTVRPRALEWAALVSILILATVLRLGAPGIVEFKRDEANLSYLSLDMVHGRDFPLLGIDSSVGIRNAPVNVYIMALPFLFTSDPTFPTQFVGLLNVIGVLLTYALVRRYYGPLAAIIAALLYAVSPWAVIYSRKIWAQDMLPMFILLTIGSGLLGFIEGKRWAQIIHLPLLAITGQIHYGTFVLVPVSLYLMIAGRKNLTRGFLYSLPIMILVLVPYAIGAASLLKPEVLNKIIAPSSSPRTLAISGLALEYTLFTIAGTSIHLLVGPDQFQNYLKLVPDAYPIFNGLLVAVILSMLWLGIRLLRYRDWRTPIDVTVLIWLLFTPLVFSLTWTPMYPHYLIPMIPAAFVALGIASADLWQALARNIPVQRIVLAVGGIALIGVVILQVWLQVALLDFLNTHNTPGGFGTPLGYYGPVREAILAQKPQQVLGNLDGQYIGYHEDTTVWNLLLYDVPVRRWLDQDTDVYPADPALYLSYDCKDGIPTFKTRPGEACYAITSRTAADLDLSRYTPIPSADKTIFANGARVITYRWEPDRGACLTLVWTTNGPRTEDFSFAVHFTNTQQQEIVYADALSWRGRYWRAGDTVVRRLCPKTGQERSGEITGVNLGMYTLEMKPDGDIFHGVDVLDTNGTPIGQNISIRFNQP